MEKKGGDQVRRSIKNASPIITLIPTPAACSTAPYPSNQKLLMTVLVQSCPIKPAGSEPSKHNRYELDPGVLPEREKAAGDKNGRKKI